MEGLLIIELLHSWFANFIEFYKFLQNVGQEGGLLSCLCVFVFDNCLTHEVMDVVFLFEFAEIDFRMDVSRLVLVMQLGT